MEERYQRMIITDILLRRKNMVYNNGEYESYGEHVEAGEDLIDTIT